MPVGQIDATYAQGQGALSDITFDGTSLWILKASGTYQDIIEVRPSDGVVLRTITTAGPNYAALTFDGSNLIAANVGTLKRIRRSDGFLVGSTSILAGNYTWSLDPTYTDLRAINANDPRLRRINPTTGALVSGLPLHGITGTPNAGIAWRGTTSLFVCAIATSARFYEIDPTSGDQAGPSFDAPGSGSMGGAVWVDNALWVTRGSMLYRLGGFNEPPHAPTLLAPADGATIDRNITQRFSWQFNDPDAGDTQSAYEIRYRKV